MQVSFWFDPTCPYTWLTSRWLVEAAAVRPISITWRLLSLSALNEHLDVDPEGDTEGHLWLPARVCAAVELAHGSEALRRIYERLHELDDWDWAKALEAAGLPAALAAAADSAEFDDHLRASTAEGVAKVGSHVGTPIIAVENGPAWFGPVISQAPAGEAAGALWDATVVVAGTPGFHELKGGPHAL
ncbi:DsbA family protein [Nonomuraea typhae]|uniref:DsbA family protein n=1 Tax=Nonomuraea typhae TaxID=2603600 RepID=A0ABW7ZCU3_9ACTN